MSTSPAITVMPVPLPHDTAIDHFYATTHLADAYAIELPPEASGDPELLARFIFAQRSVWGDALMRLRDALVAGLGLKTSGQMASLSAEEQAARVAIFRIYTTTPTEIVLGEDDTHLDFRVSVLCSSASPDSARRLTVSTVVHCHNLLGRVYIRIIAPFHRRLVKHGLRSAARAGWTRDSDLSPDDKPAFGD